LGAAVTFSDFVNIAQVVAMIAALAAVWYAEQTVHETRALRREERVARLPDLIAELARAGTEYSHGRMAASLDVPRLRLRAALTATGERLPVCERLLTVDWPYFITDSDAVEREAEALAAVGAAMDEVAALLVELRAEGATDADRDW
jgi:hypothetical protein